MLHHFENGRQRGSRVARWIAIVTLIGVAGIAAWPSPAHAQSAQSATSVNVLLDEWNLIPDIGFAEAGDVTFVATNAGERSHELVVVATDLAVDGLPVDDEGERVLEDQLAVVGRTSRLGSGETTSLTLSLDPGNYVLICNLPNHYTRGQRWGFVVTEAGAAPPASLPTTGSGGLADGAGSGPSALLSGLVAMTTVLALSAAGRATVRGRARRRAG